MEGPGNVESLDRRKRDRKAVEELEGGAMVGGMRSCHCRVEVALGREVDEGGPGESEVGRYGFVEAAAEGYECASEA